MAVFQVFIDVLNDHRISGWCFDLHDPGTPARLTFYADGQKLGDVAADTHREDLKALNLHPTGRCGFEFSIPDSTVVGSCASLYIYARGSGGPIWECRADEVPRMISGKLPAVFFMHIPKTAGTSFNTFISSLFHKDAVATHIENMETDRYLSLQKEKSYLAGHRPLRDIKRWFDISRFDLLTLLREPYRQLHSHVRWIKNIGADPEGGFFLSHHRFFRELALRLNEPDFSIPDGLEALSLDQPGDLVSLFDNNQTRHFLDGNPKKVSRSDFQAAKQNLDCFKLVGATEQYTQFVSSFCNSYGLNYIDQRQRFNQSNGEMLFDYHDENVKLKLFPLVEFDLLLYEHVVKNRLWDRRD